MLRHIVMYKLKDNSDAAKQALVDKFMSMDGIVEELIDIKAGADVLMSDRSYDVVLETTFKNRTMMEQYQNNPFHQMVKEYVRSVVEKSHSVDYVIKDTFATIKLEDGRTMTAQLFKEDAPLSVENFIKLAKADFYSGLIFHRVIPGFMIQGGGMNENLQSKNGADKIKGEFLANGVNNTVRHSLGTLSMARTSDPNSATSQFFICVDETPHLDGQYAAFGRLVDDESIKVAVDISNVDTHSVGYYDDVPVEPIRISSIVIFEE